MIKRPLFFFESDSDREKRPLALDSEVSYVIGRLLVQKEQNGATNL